MIRIAQIKIGITDSVADLKKKAASLLHIHVDQINDFKIIRKSLDARKKNELTYCYTIDISIEKEEEIVKRSKCKQACIVEDKPYTFPKVTNLKEKQNPIIVGMGPAGLFCAYFLAREGFQPIIMERGKDVDERQIDVERFFEQNILNEESNIQFGEGGAGTFSDGKLNTLVKDKYGRNQEVLRLFVKFGAPEDILYESKPHIGTDILKEVIRNMREEIISMGGCVLFNHQVTDLLIENDRICGVCVNGKEYVKASNVILAIGHSARNTFEMLNRKRISMEPKPFAIGFRVEHEQQMINESQYGKQNSNLPAAPYKLTCKTKEQRGVYSFCMCPGGYVVNASSEKNRLCVNGMSYHSRDSHNANSAIVVTITPDDYQGKDPLSGMYFQRKLEEKAYKAGDGKIPVQTYKSFKMCVNGENSKADDGKEFDPVSKGHYQFANLIDILPMNLNEDIIEGMEQFGRIISGFSKDSALLSGIESRTSSPIRILRDDNMESSVKGLFPCGEGAGYAGGITSAAMDGIKIAETIALL